MNVIQYKLQENPGITGAVVAGLFGLLVQALASYGLALTPELEALITALIVVIFPVVGAYVARHWSTPLVRPMDNEGNRLVPEYEAMVPDYLQPGAAQEKPEAAE
jgi:hypothetical protein